MRIDFKLRRPLLAPGGATASAPAAAVQSPPRRGFSVPFVNRLSLRSKMLWLTGLVAGSLLLAMGFNALGARQASMHALQTRLVGESLMHSQRLGKAAPNAIQGNPEAFAQLEQSRRAINDALKRQVCDSDNE